MTYSIASRLTNSLIEILKYPSHSQHICTKSDNKFSKNSLEKGEKFPISVLLNPPSTSSVSSSPLGKIKSMHRAEEVSASLEIFQHFNNRMMIQKLYFLLNLYYEYYYVSQKIVNNGPSCVTLFII